MSELMSNDQVVTGDEDIDQEEEEVRVLML